MVVASMGDEAADPAVTAAATAAAAASLMSDETLDPPPSPTLVEASDDGPSPVAAVAVEMASAAACTSVRQSSEPPQILNCDFPREQVAAAEERVCKSLQQVMESIETRLMGALRQAAIDIIENLGKEAATYILFSERKALVLEQQLNSSKQQALSMLMRLKQVSDSQIFDAEKKILIERRRAQDAEAKLYNTLESNKRLKAELKRKSQLLDELQRNIYPAGTEQGFQMGFTEGLDSRKKASRSKGSGGVKHPQQIASTPCEPVTRVMSPGLAVFSRPVNGVVEMQSANINTQLPVNNLTFLDGYTARRIQMGLPATEVLPTDHINLQVEKNIMLKEDGNVRGESNGPLEGEPPKDASALVQGAYHSPTVLQPTSMLANSHTSFDQVGGFTSAAGSAQFPLSQKGNLELKSMKDSEEDKSCLTIEVLHCNEQYLPPLVHRLEEYQSDVNHTEMEQETSDGSKHQISGGNKDEYECHVSMNSKEKLDVVEGPERAGESVSNGSATPKIITENYEASGSLLHSGPVSEMNQEGSGTVSQDGSPKLELECGEARNNVETTSVTAQAVLDTVLIPPELLNSKSDGAVTISPPAKPISHHSGSNLPGEDAYRPDTINESPGNQVLRRKRKQAAVVSKYDLSVKERSSKRLEEEAAVAGAFNHLAAAGVDTHISSRDSRRLMQGARQLFSLAERKWR